MRRWAVAALAVMAVAGCAPRRIEQLPPPTSLELPAAADLLGSLRARRESIRGLRAVARMSYTVDGDSRRARQILVAERPDRLRLEVLSPFGTVFVLATDKGQLAAYVPEEGVVYRGRASADNLARYIPIDLPVSTAVDLILGTPPMDGRREPVVSREDGLLKLWQDAERRVYVIWFTDRLDPARYEQRDEEGRVLLRASFADFSDVASVRLPMQIGVELPPSQQRIDIALREPEVNPVVADATFALQTPPGIREIVLDREQ